MYENTDCKGLSNRDGIAGQRWKVISEKEHTEYEN